tara:strand:+ start:724 stop:1092 length:369 start_codon:yes stop_codon:yes gene_type:complete
MPKRSTIIEGEECSCLISAKITPSAFAIYNEWRRLGRVGGGQISLAILRLQNGDAFRDELRADLAEANREIAELRDEIRGWMRSIGALNQSRQEAWDEISELYAPQQRRLDDFSTDQPSDDE